MMIICGVYPGVLESLEVRTDEWKMYFVESHTLISILPPLQASINNNNVEIDTYVSVCVCVNVFLSN